LELQNVASEQSIFINTISGDNNLKIDIEQLEGKELKNFKIDNLTSDVINCKYGNFENINTEFKTDE
jgi:phosphoribosylformylglycinamidine (FGAM) synthase-like amidotransferase family enzyme